MDEKETEKLFDLLFNELKDLYGGDDEEIALNAAALGAALETAGYRKADEACKEKAKEILSGLVHWLKGAIRDSYDHAVKEHFGIYGGKNHAFHEMLDLVEKIAEKEGVGWTNEKRERS